MEMTRDEVRNLAKAVSSETLRNPDARYVTKSAGIQVLRSLERLGYRILAQDEGNDAGIAQGFIEGCQK